VYNDNKKKAAKQKNVGAGSVAKKSGCVWLVPNNKKGGGRSKKKGDGSGMLDLEPGKEADEENGGRDFGWLVFGSGSGFRLGRI